ncbi:uncharacterized protein LOC120778479 [Bactrocera tryoni]|uniref:uncharacterized protein LOC120778479 n=1 Tax=Bactrocera tryoni TaxID=59916 RepID=UPI001A9839CF|nr:uncharacterized protein LOC120778479 [Bactrocera tryoni]
MLDTIVYIPTILAYVFILLLVVILCFIVVYVSHRIYVCIYDNLPVAHAAISTIMSMEYKDNLPSRSNSGIVLSSNEALHERKAKTALRIIVTLAPCYLAYVPVDTEKHGKSTDDFELNADYHEHKMIKYYDRLSQIPITDHMSSCVSERQLYPSSRRVAKRRASSRIAATTRDNAPIKTVATSTTRLTQFIETGNNFREVAASSLSAPTVRPSVTFAHAMNALGNIKINPPEDPL